MSQNDNVIENAPSEYFNEAEEIFNFYSSETPYGYLRQMDERDQNFDYYTHRWWAYIDSNGIVLATAENYDELAKEVIEKAKLDPAKKVPFSLLLPSFVTSELKTAFQIGFLIFIPFLVIYLVVASVLMSMGMMMLSPMIISLPFKLMLFVLIDGWSLVMGTMASSFYV